jgi:hypothetical protein
MSTNLKEYSLSGMQEKGFFRKNILGSINLTISESINQSVYHEKTKRSIFAHKFKIHE